MKLGDKLKAAGYQAMQGDFGSALKTLTLDPSTYGQKDRWIFEAVAGQFFTWEGSKSSLNAYNSCPTIAAIVNRQSQAYVNGKTWILDSKGEEATTKEGKKLRQRLRFPNPIQNWRQFESQGKIYQKLYGYNVVLIIKPVGFKEAIDASALWNITPWCEIKENPITSLYPVQAAKDLVKSVHFVYEGKATVLDMDDLFIMKDLSASFNTILLPTSPIKTLEMPINNIIGALESENVMINNRGPMHVISSNKSDESGNLPFTLPEKQALQDDFGRYGLRKGQWKQIITSASINVQSIGHSVRDLMLIESVAENSKICCDVLNYPAHLLGLLDPTFNNQNAAEKGLYQNSIIPDAENNYEQWNDLFQTEQYNLKIDKDYSHVAVLQDDESQKATAKKTMTEALKMQYELGLITLNECLLELGRDPIGNLGQVRSTDVKNSNVPLASIIGVGGVQSLIQVLTATGISEDAKRNTLEILFGIAASDAARMVTEPENQNNQTATNEQGNSNA